MRPDPQGTASCTDPLPRVTKEALSRGHCHCTHISTLPVHTLCITGSLEPLKYPALLISSKPTVLTLVLPERFWSLATAARVDRGSEDVPGERGRTSWDPHSKARQIVVCGTRSEP